MQAWAKDQGIDLAVEETEGGGKKIASSFEFYPVDPRSEEDFTRWETRLLMMAED